MFELNWNGKKLFVNYAPEISDYLDGVAFFAVAHDEIGNEYEIRWDYVEPEWHEGLTPADDGYYTNDLSDFADWKHPAEVTEL